MTGKYIGKERNHILALPKLTFISNGLFRCSGKLLTNGWYLDVLVAYLFRIIARSIMTLRSRRWPTRKATVTRSDSPNGFACEVVKVVYTYSFNGDHYGGTDTKPFLFKQIAEINTKEFPSGKEITVRVNPDNPSVSVLRYS